MDKKLKKSKPTKEEIEERAVAKAHKQRLRQLREAEDFFSYIDQKIDEFNRKIDEFNRNKE